ncbi:DUF418 domain-containing protein [Piscinibacterium candidicorallinum]|uniref:DUF418 domain-containing protein n=1 Tax=Piscinibacterium candidicorallinum TaxID=1793872 RepID=A0ABV7GZS7_9BURK
MAAESARLPAPKRSRAEIIDALRIWALLGVFVVNFVSYPGTPMSTPIGQPLPADSTLALAIHSLIAALFQGKSYPLLMFLFGYSFALSMRAIRSADSLEFALGHRKSRMLILLALGIIHGLFVYMGDILTSYAICGLILLRWGRRSVTSLLRILKVLLGIWAVSYVAINVAIAIYTYNKLEEPVIAPDPTSTFAGVDAWLPFLELNSIAYVVSTVLMLPLFLPQLLALCLAGFICGRLRVLEQPQRWTRLLEQARFWGLLIGIPLGLTYGVLAWHVLGSRPAFEALLLGMGTLTGPPILAGLIAAIALSWPHGGWPRLRALAPAGRNTLSMYLGLSLLMALLLSGAGLGWGQKLDSSGLFGLALLLYALALCWAWASAHRGQSGPFERLINAASQRLDARRQARLDQGSTTASH